MKIATTAGNVSELTSMFEKSVQVTNDNISRNSTNTLVKIAAISNGNIRLVSKKTQQKEPVTQYIQPSMMKATAFPQKNGNITSTLFTTNHSKSEMESVSRSKCDINSQSVKNTNEEQSKSNVFKNGIPKLIHFVWEGENISEMDLANVFLNAMLAPGFSVNIWTTEPSSIRSTLDEMSNSENNAQYRFLARKFGPSISINDTKKLYDELKTHLITQEHRFGDITKAGFLYSVFSREINGIYKNYAAASDITRAALMYLKGGCYMDVDVVCRSLPQLESNEIEQGYLIGESHHTKGLFNALLVSLPKSKISHNILEQMANGLMEAELREKYEDDDKLPLWVTKRSDEKSRWHDTLEMTGPGLLYDMRLHRKRGILYDADVIFRQKTGPETPLVEIKNIDEILFSNFQKGFNGEGGWGSIDSTRLKGPVTI